MRLRRTAFIGGAAIIFVVVIFALLSRLRPRLSEEMLQQRVVTTIQQEAKASFLVTGTLDIVATTSVENTRQILPQIIDLSLGTSKATIQVPGRAHYGFDVRTLKADNIKLAEDNVIEIDVPQPVVYSVEPNLHGMQVWTTKGWARTQASAQRAERRALTLINGALMRQAQSHVLASVQPRVNTAEALKVLLTPTLESLGIENPVFRFRVGDRIVIER